MPTNHPPHLTSLFLFGLLTCVPQTDAQQPEAPVTDGFAAPAGVAAVTGETPATTGSIRGRIVDKDTGRPLGGVAIMVVGTGLGTVTQPDGRYVIDGVPAGTSQVTCSKTGFVESKITEVKVVAGQTKALDFTLPPLPADATSEVFELQDFTVTAEEASAHVANLDVRIRSDKLLDLFSAEDFSKFAASDVADALKRISGVNIVEGQFAIIRGLENRYSSTTYNGAPVPSPDPNSQSVQLDLFPSDVVSNLVVAKTFSGDLPSNSSGGNIDIVTHGYPQKLEIKVSGGTGFNDNATDRFIKLQPGSATGREQDGFSDVIESKFGISAGGRTKFKDREVRFKAVASHDVDYDTRTGVTESREPRLAEFRNFPRPPRVVRSGDLSLGLLSLSGGRFDLTQSDHVEQTTGYLGLGINLDKEGLHKIDASLFYTRKQEETVRLEENGVIPGFDYSALSLTTFNPDEPAFNDFASNSAWILRGAREDLLSDPPSKGHLWFAPTFESLSLEQDRDLLVGQVNGSHSFEVGGDLTARWAVNKVKTTQDEESYGARYFYEPDNMPVTVPDAPLSVEDLGPGQFVSGNDVFFSSNQIEENLDFGRVDLDYEREVTSWLKLKLSTGASREKAERSVDSRYLQSPTVGGVGEFSVAADTAEGLGSAIFDQLDRVGGQISGTKSALNEATREVDALHFGTKATFWDKVDLLASLRLEDLVIESLNNPFFEESDGRQNMFPNRFVLANVVGLPSGSIGDPFVEGAPFDPADLPFYQELVNGRIDEDLFLPAAGVTVRPISGMAVRAAWSETVARPSFREVGYYVSVDPGSSELVVGNPQLELSDVESLDLRLDYTWGDGDLVAVSVFSKKIENPIESLVIRDPTNAENSGGLFRTFVNNPDTADLRGFEVEARKNLGFLGAEFAKYFSFGGNYTFIDAEVERTPAELANTAGFFGVADGDIAAFTELSSTRRLFGQPEWIANVDITFDQPDWGTRVTVAYFAISDVLDAAGSASIGPSGRVEAITLDRYVGSYGQLDLLISQTWGDWTFKFSVKNLTDSTRKIIYDPNQTASEIAETSYKVGRYYSLSASYEF